MQARRIYQRRPANWGLINVGLLSEGDHVWLVVEDNGIGMSEQVLTGPLLDFGMSFWRSTLTMEEFPGLMAAGMHAIGRFGIGFSPSSWTTVEAIFVGKARRYNGRFLQMGSHHLIEPVACTPAVKLAQTA